MFPLRAMLFSCLLLLLLPPSHLRATNGYDSLAYGHGELKPLVMEGLTSPSDTLLQNSHALIAYGKALPDAQLLATGYYGVAEYYRATDWVAAVPYYDSVLAACTQVLPLEEVAGLMQAYRATHDPGANWQEDSLLRYSRIRKSALEKKALFAVQSSESATAIDLMKRSLAEAHAQQDSARLGYSYMNFAYLQDYTGQADSVEGTLKEALRWFPPNLPDRSNAMNLLATYYVDKGRISEGLSLLLEALPLARQDMAKLGDVYSITLGNIGHIYRKQKLYDKAMAYFYEELALEQALGLKNQAAYTGNSIGRVHMALGSYDSARWYHERSLAQYQQQENQASTALTHTYLAHLALVTGQVGEALEHVAMGDSLVLGSQEYEPRFMLALRGAEAYLALGQNRQALTYALQANALMNELGWYVFEREAAEVLYKVYAALGQYREALAQHERFKRVADSLQRTEEVNKVATYLAEEKAAREKDVLEAQKAQAEAELARQTLQRNVTLAGGVLLATFLLVALYFYVAKRKDNRKLRDQNAQISQQARALEELGRYKEGLTGMLVHDLKNPLNVIMGLTDNHGGHRGLQLIAQCGRQMLRLVMNMLDVQRYESQKMQLQLEPTPLWELSTQAQAQVQTLLQGKSMPLETTIDPALVLRADAEVFVRVLINLLTNAIKYSPIGTTVRMVARVEGDQLLLQVTDQGHGIAAEHLPHVFDRFWKGSQVEEGQSLSRSTGLGLTFVKLAIEAHGGQVSVSSEAAKGTTFTLALPYDATLRFEGEATEPPAPTDSRKVTLNATDRDVLFPHLPALQNTKVFQLGSFNKQMAQLEPLASESLEYWLHLLRAAVAAQDQAMYDRLLSQAIAPKQTPIS